MATENKFPTIRDLRDRLSELVNLGLGDLPTQLTVVPPSTIIAVAHIFSENKPSDKPPLMLEFGGVDGRMGAIVISTDYLGTETAAMLNRQ